MRIFETVERGEGTLRKINKRFLVSLFFVTRQLQHHGSGSTEPPQSPPGPSARWPKKPAIPRRMAGDGHALAPFYNWLQYP